MSQTANKFNLLGVQISLATMTDAIRQVEGLIRRKESDYICVSNVHTVMMGMDDERYKRITNDAAMAFPDGMPLVAAGKLMGHQGIGRVSGPDFMIEFMQDTAHKGYRHYFYGGAEGTPELLSEMLQARFPGLQVCGAYSPPFRPLSMEEDEQVVKMINDANPDIVWVGLGAPKQEIWMSEHKGRVNAILIGVGAAFDFHTGKVARAPKWAQKIGLEWAHRLLSEPKRLWRRYLSTNPRFMMMFALQVLRLKKF